MLFLMGCAGFFAILIVQAQAYEKFLCEDFLTPDLWVKLSRLQHAGPFCAISRVPQHTLH